MRKIYMTKILISAVLLLSVSSCEKFLDVKPKGKDIIENIDHYNGLLNNIMLLTLQNVRTLENGSTMILGAAGAPLIMSDDVFTTPQNFGSRAPYEINAYKWSDRIYEENEDPNEWGAMYVPIYVYNLAINGVMNCTGATDQRKREVQAEARINRAFNYLFLINQFAKPYNSSTAAQDPGVPLVTKADITAKDFTRATVKEIYDFIIKEIEESIPDLPVQAKVRVRLGRSAAWFILGRTYFYMGNYAKAITALNNSENAVASLPFKVELYDYNTLMNTAPPAGWYNPAQPNRGASGHPTMFDSFEVIYMRQLAIIMNYFFSNIFVKDAVMNKFGTSDLRRRLFSNKDYMMGSTTLPGYQRCSPASVNWGASLPDLYLMRAECKARINDLPGAKADLETLRKKRMPVADATVPVTTKDAMIRFVLDERIREFAGTGMRWFDMRRLSTDPDYNNIDYTRTFGTETLTLQNKRLTMKIPAKIMLYNPGMVDND
jgi:hypothetical protein